MEASRTQQREIRVAGNLREGVTFFEGFYFFSGKNVLRAFSSTCTHAGCTLTREENGAIICPCHGSRFEASTGSVLNGPAQKPLSRIKYKTDAQSNELVVFISD